VSVATVSSGGGNPENQGDAGAGLKPGWGVSPDRQQALVDTMQDLAPLSGRLSPAQLRTVTVELSRRRELWADLVVHDPDVRWSLPLHRSNSCDVWLLAWERGQDTDWHDHGGSSGSFAVAEGSLLEQYRVPSGRRLARRRLAVGEAVAFGPGHVHDVGHGGEDSATSIHAYSPPLSAMTYYSATDYGLIARETVAIDGPEGGRGRGGADTALARATASAARLTSDELPDGAPGIDELLAEARSGLRRLRP
jgi:predicted metal-dependent enzyme (double-stranded beta helix superfamily)